MAKRDAVVPGGRQARHEKNRCSAAAHSGDLLFVARQIGSREPGPSEPDFAKPVALAFDDPGAVPRTGCIFDDVVEVTMSRTGPGPRVNRSATVSRVQVMSPREGVTTAPRRHGASA